MNLILQKFISWILFLTGLIIIFWTLYSCYNIFTGKNFAPEIFRIEEKIIQNESAKKEKIPTSPAELQKEMEKMISEQLKEIIPAKTLTNLLNLIAWSIFCGILIFGGSQISSLGIKLMRK